MSDSSNIFETIVIVGLMGVLFPAAYFFLMDEESEPEVNDVAPEVVPDRRPETINAICGIVSTRCLAETEFKTEDCNQNARKKAERALIQPLRTGSCKTAEGELSVKCGESCELDLSSKIVVPGSLELDIGAKSDTFGQCLVRAKKEVTIRAKCIPIPSTQGK